MEAVISFIVVYLVIGILVFYTVKMMLLSNLDYTIREEREVAEDDVAINITCAIVGLLWVIYVPYAMFQLIRNHNEV